MNDTTPSLPDFGHHGQKTATFDQLKRISEAVDEYLDAVAAAAEAEAAFKEAKKLVVRYEEHLLPEAMREAGMLDFTTTSGYKVKIKSDVRASIPKAKEADAFRWLEENGQGGLIKRTVEVPFAMGEEERVEDLMNDLQEREFSCGARKKIESSTLRSFVRKQLEDPSNKFPMDLFGASTYDKADVKSPKG